MVMGWDYGRSRRLGQISNPRVILARGRTRAISPRDTFFHGGCAGSDLAHRPSFMSVIIVGPQHTTWRLQRVSGSIVMNWPI
jgi:hypothetical protein